ncbi:unnamed protein product [Linum trigynum]|uniref:Uncharacterized protein n=1 Tax=Linum trigynum TaxID=586398 RepID=A0AAV2C5Z7_9ROSI
MEGIREMKFVGPTSFRVPNPWTPRTWKFHHLRWDLGDGLKSMMGSTIPGEEPTKDVAADHEDQDVESVESLESLFQVAEATDVEEKGGSLNEFRRVIIGMTERLQQAKTENGKLARRVIELTRVLKGMEAKLDKVKREKGETERRLMEKERVLKAMEVELEPLMAEKRERSGI